MPCIKRCQMTDQQRLTATFSRATGRVDARAPVGHNARMQPSIGRIVHYHLTAAQANSLTAEGSAAWSGSHAENPEPYGEGDPVAAIVTRVDPTPSLVSLRLFPDRGWETPTVRNVGEGDLPGEWGWPPRV